MQHNYARWNNQIINQGGPTNDQYASLWSQLAKKYASTEKVIVSGSPYHIAHGFHQFYVLYSLSNK